MLDHSRIGRRKSTRSVDEILARTHQSHIDSQAVLKMVAQGDLNQQQSTVLSRDVIRQCRDACSRASRLLDQ